MPPDILIVEDDESIRKLASVNLSARGYNVDEAESAEECFARLEEAAPSLILLDVKLPDESGLSLLEQFEEIPDLASIPVIVMTASVLDASEIKAQKYPNVREVIVKPFEVSDLIAVISNVLDKG